MTALAERATVRGGALKPWVLGVAATFCCGWGGNQFTPLLAMYRSRDGFSEVTVDAMLAFYVFGLVPALLLSGKISDARGRRALMTFALGICALGSLSIATTALPLVAAGRFMSGIGIGLAMGVGTTWVVELSVREGASPRVGARRAALWLTGGLGFGAGIAGVLAQWGPLPQQLPYFIQVAATLTVLAMVMSSGVETLEAVAAEAPAGVIPVAVRHPRFRRMVLPMAPWIFATGGVAYAVVPGALDSHVGHWTLLYGTVLTVSTLGAGFLIQPVASRLDHHVHPRGMTIAMVTLTLGIVLAAIVVSLQLAWLALVPAVVLGSAYGFAIVSGLLEIQRLSPPEELARATGIFYALAYIGFLFPVMIAIADHWTTTTAALWTLAIICGLCATSIAARWLRAHALSPSTVA